jgi:membrane-bound lytic murein transglycosylase B
MAVNRPLLLACALGALVALVPTAPAAAEARAPAKDVPVADIAPELSAVAVDGTDYRAAQSRFDASTAALADAQSVLISSTNELAQLHTEDGRLTAQLAYETGLKKDATIEKAKARGALRALAVESYVHGQPDPDTVDDVNAATQALSHQALAQAVGEEQIANLQAADDAADRALRTITADLVARATVRDRTADVQAAHDKATADETQLTADLVGLQANLDRARVTAMVVGEDFALVALDAYWKAAKAMTASDPACGIPWWALAGITRSESRHGTYGGAHLLANGDVDRVIVGIPLDGTNDTAVIADTDGGALDGDPVYDHAVGPMQFIPSTWRRWARDGNGDGVDNPNNIYDAALAAAKYLCASGPMQTDDQMRRGFLSYNQSDAYATAVLNYAKSYSRFQIASQ